MIIQETVLINASIEKVWNTFTDLTRWKEWCTVLEDVSSECKRLTEGASFRCSIRPFDIPMDLEPVVEEVLVHESIVWSAAKHGISARHEFTFDQEEDQILLTSRETFSGLLFSPLRLLFPKNKIKQLSLMMLEEIRTEAERGNGSN